jgi:outer membrane PBP1 activator LpoA protein
LLKRSKAANKLKEAGFCCFCQVSNEIHQGQRQQTSSRKQDFAASAKCPMKLTKVKGSKQASGSRILLLLPWTQ